MLRERNEAGLYRLLEDHGARVRGVLLRDFGQLREIERDAALNAASHDAWQQAARYDRDRASLCTWFCNLALRHARRIASREERLRRRHEALELEGLAVAEPGAAPVPSEFLAALEDCIGRLPGVQQVIVRADLEASHVADGESLARRLGTTTNSIYSSRSQARKRLRDCLDRKGLALAPEGESAR